MIAPADRRQRDAPEGLGGARAEGRRGLLLVGPHLAQHRDHLAHDERQRHEDRREHHAGDGEDHLDARRPRRSPPNQPSCPQTSRMQRPTTTGERARGRSMRALTNERPGTRRRTRMSAAATPKTALRGTAIAVIRIVSHRACSASGLVTASQNVAKPSSKVRYRTKQQRGHQDEPPGSRARWPAGRSARRARRRACPDVSGHDASYQRSRADRSRSETSEMHQQAHRHGGRRRRPVGLDLADDVERRDLGVEGDVARDEHERAELAERAGEGEAGAAEDRRDEVREDDAAEDGEGPRAERGGGLLHVAVELDQDRLDGPHHEGQRDEQQRDHDAGAREGEVQPDRAARAVEGEQGQAGDDGRQRERKVDEGVDDAACRGSRRARAPRR